MYTIAFLQSLFTELAGIYLILMIFVRLNSKISYKQIEYHLFTCSRYQIIFMKSRLNVKIRRRTFGLGYNLFSILRVLQPYATKRNSD